jgi:hypothetical protein
MTRHLDTCPAHLNGGPLACTRPRAHLGAHVFVASDSPDRHALTEGGNE